MSDTKRVLIDADGVFINFITPALETISTIAGRTFTVDEIPTWDIFDYIPREYEDRFYEEISKMGWCRQLKPYPGAIEGIKRLMTMADVYFVTSPVHSPTWCYERTNWIYDHFGVTAKKVVLTSAKYICEGDILIDDRPDHVINWQKAHPMGMGVLWRQPYNASVTLPYTASRWSDIEAMLFKTG